MDIIKSGSNTRPINNSSRPGTHPGVSKEIVTVVDSKNNISLSSSSPSSTLLIGKVTPKQIEKMEVVEASTVLPPTTTAKSTGERGHILPNGYWNTNETKEEDYQMLAVYTVSDLPTEDEEPNRAERSLPRNLYLKQSGVNNEFVGVFSTDYIPVGTRFGPVVGDRWHPQEVPPNTCRKYFWRVSFTKKSIK